MNLIVKFINRLKSIFGCGGKEKKKKEVANSIRRARKNDPFIYD